MQFSLFIIICMNLSINEQFINDYPLFDIEGIIICISEYIGRECKMFVTFLDKNNSLEYLYTYYESEIVQFVHPITLCNEYKKVRYLKNVTNTNNLKKYKNVI
jgi:hypothetical protein